jgi:hypothetical protein
MFFFVAVIFCSICVLELRALQQTGWETGINWEEITYSARTVYLQIGLHFCKIVLMRL